MHRKHHAGVHGVTAIFIFITLFIIIVFSLSYLSLGPSVFLLPRCSKITFSEKHFPATSFKLSTVTHENPSPLLVTHKNPSPLLAVFIHVCVHIYFTALWAFLSSLTHKLRGARTVHLLGSLLALRVQISASCREGAQ